MKIVSVDVLRVLFRGLLAFRAIYEDWGLDTLNYEAVGEWSLWDLEYLYAKSQTPLLSPRQSQAIELCLVQNMIERHAAKEMGIKPTNPVSMYANSGLTVIVTEIHAGRMEHFKPTPGSMLAVA